MPFLRQQFLKCRHTHIHMHGCTCMLLGSDKNYNLLPRKMDKSTQFRALMVMMMPTQGLQIRKAKSSIVSLIHLLKKRKKSVQ